MIGVLISVASSLSAQVNEVESERRFFRTIRYRKQKGLNYKVNFLELYLLPLRVFPVIIYVGYPKIVAK